MPEPSFRDVSRRIQSEKSLKYIGTARVKLNALSFPNASCLDTRNVERLKSLFRGQRGCNPEDLQNRIPAVIDEIELDELMRISGITRESLRAKTQHPILDLPEGAQLSCLRGQHRVRAAQEILASDRRWVVDLFAAGG